MDSSRPIRRRDMLVFALPVAGVLAMLLVLFTSAIRTSAETREWIRDRGGTVTTNRVPLLPLAVAADFLWLPEVVAIDLSTIPTTDDELERVAEIQTLSVLSVRGPSLTDTGLASLEHLTELRSLTLIDCPQVSEPALKRLRGVNPAMQLQVRGPAFLGVAGHTHPEGCQIVHVQSGSAADAAGLRPGDVVTALDTEPVPGFEELVRLLRRFEPGDEVELAVWRGGMQDTERTEIRLQATLGKW